MPLLVGGIKPVAMSIALPSAIVLYCSKPHNRTDLTTKMCDGSRPMFSSVGGLQPLSMLLLSLGSRSVCLMAARRQSENGMTV